MPLPEPQPAAARPPTSAALLATPSAVIGRVEPGDEALLLAPARSVHRVWLAPLPPAPDDDPRRSAERVLRFRSEASQGADAALR